ncbi:MAG TPA: hypothetical protein VFB03_03570 [Candidatus Saccharimonadales bacterium]|nr:hypothetical protein [Candidatus Saccharimonadales bacterium]
MRSKLFGVILTFVFVVLSFELVHAETVVRGFNTKSYIPPGWVVALSSDNKNSVVLAPAKDPAKMYGVVIDPNDAPLAVQKQDQQVFVATNGIYPVFVSTQNGTIKAGDYLSMSSADGVAAKADSQQPLVLGRAQEAFDGKSGAIVHTSEGSDVGLIAVQIALAKNPLIKEAVPIPEPLRQISQSVAGKSVSGLRIYVALGIFMISGLISIILMASGIRNGMIAIGRNPLSRHGIMKSLFAVIGAAAMVLIMGLLGVYLLLKI